MKVLEVHGSSAAPFVAGVFEDPHEAERFRARLSVEPGRVIREREVDAGYPLFVVEQAGDFWLGSVHAAWRRIRSAADSCPDSEASPGVHSSEDSVVSVYVVRQDFAPEPPGADCMGLLPHWHLTASECARISGPPALWGIGEPRSPRSAGSLRRRLAEGWFAASGVFLLGLAHTAPVPPSVTVACAAVAGVFLAVAGALFLARTGGGSF